MESKMFVIKTDRHPFKHIKSNSKDKGKDKVRHGITYNIFKILKETTAKPGKIKIFFVRLWPSLPLNVLLRWLRLFSVLFVPFLFLFLVKKKGRY